MTGEIRFRLLLGIDSQYIFFLAVLVLFLTKELMFNKDKGKTVYHAFSMVSYFTGVLGAMLADSLLGKYRSG